MKAEERKLSILAPLGLKYKSLKLLMGKINTELTVEKSTV
jgi:hypothetical protein